MKSYGYFIPKGTSILATKRNSDGSLEVEPKLMKKDVIYFLNKIVIDPLYPSENQDEKHFASRGFFGFALSENKAGYEMIICHSQNIKMKSMSTT